MDNVKRRRGCMRGMLVVLLSTVPLMALSSNMATVTVKVTVVKPPPCIINDDRPIEVDFGEVMTTRVDGNNYMMPVNYTISCENGDARSMEIQISGTPAGFDNTALRTTSTGLGIAIKSDYGRAGAKISFPINDWYQGYQASKPWGFWAVPVKQNGTTLRGGEFTAGATMKVAYQ